LESAVHDRTVDGGARAGGRLTSLRAQGGDPSYTIYGYGTKSCGAWTQDAAEDQRQQGITGYDLDLAWIEGSVTAGTAVLSPLQTVIDSADTPWYRASGLRRCHVRAATSALDSMRRAARYGRSDYSVRSWTSPRLRADFTCAATQHPIVRSDEAVIHRGSIPRWV